MSTWSKSTFHFHLSFYIYIPFCIVRCTTVISPITNFHSFCASLSCSFFTRGTLFVVINTVFLAENSEKGGELPLDFEFPCFIHVFVVISSINKVGNVCAIMIIYDSLSLSMNEKSSRLLVPYIMLKKES